MASSSDSLTLCSMISSTCFFKEKNPFLCFSVSSHQARSVAVTVWDSTAAVADDVPDSAGPFFPPHPSSYGLSPLSLHPNSGESTNSRIPRSTARKSSTTRNALSGSPGSRTLSRDSTLRIVVQRVRYKRYGF